MVNTPLRDKVFDCGDDLVVRLPDGRLAVGLISEVRQSSDAPYGRFGLKNHGDVRITVKVLQKIALCVNRRCYRAYRAYAKAEFVHNHSFIQPDEVRRTRAKYLWYYNESILRFRRRRLL